MTEEKKQSLLEQLAQATKLVTGILPLLVMSLPILLIIGDSERLRSVVRDLAGLAEFGESVSEISVSMDEMSTIMDALTRRLDEVDKRLNGIDLQQQAETTPVLHFTRGNNFISDGYLGGYVNVRWSFIKLRNCGSPVVTLRLRNGDNRDHVFEDVSVIGTDGRGVSYDANPNLVRFIEYSARIPSDGTVVPGNAVGWVTLTYPDCRLAPTAISPEVNFRINPPPESVHDRPPFTDAEKHEME